MRKTLFVGIAGLIAIGVGLYAVVVRPAMLPSPDAPRAERALATSDLLLLADVNVKQAVFLEKWFLGSPIVDTGEETKMPAVPDRTLLDHLRAAGARPRTDLDQTFFALYHADEATSRRAIVLLGRFDPAALGDYLVRELKSTARTEDGRAVYDVTRRDPTTCQPDVRWTVALDPHWVLLADAASLTVVLPRMNGTPPDADAVLAWWRPLAHSDVLGLGIINPAQLGAAVTQPLLQTASQAMAMEAEGIDRAYVGLGVKVVPPQGRLRMVVDAGDATHVGQRLQTFRKAVDESRARWAETMPIVAKLYDSLQLRSEGTRTTIAFTVDRTLGQNLQELAQEAVSAFMTGLGVKSVAPPSAPSVEQIDPTPAVFKPAVTAAELPAYDAHAMFAEEVEVQKGPFGIRIEALRLAKDPTVGLEASVAAFSGPIPNAVEGEEMRLFVDSVRSGSGQELLRMEECGKDRNALPARFSSTGSSGFKAEKTVRLVPGVEPRTIASVSGHVELRLPTRTETATIPRSGPDSTVRRVGATFAVSRVEGGTVGYRIGGAVDRVLHFRGLNAQGKPLSSSGGFWGDFLFGEGRAGQKEYAGAVDRLEVVFASELQALQFPFTLSDLSMIGKTDHVFLDTTPAFRPYGYQAMRADRYVANAWKPLPPPAKPESHQSTTLLEPFELSFDRAQAFYALKLDFTLRSPDLPNFQKVFSVGRLQLTRIELKDGTVLEAPADVGTPNSSIFAPTWIKALQFPAAPRDGVLATSLSFLVDSKAKPEDIKSISGVLTVQFPTVLETVGLDDLTVGQTARRTDTTITVEARGHHNLTLAVNRAGDTVLYARLMNAQGQAVAFSGPRTTALADGGESFELMPMSPYVRTDVVIATARDVKSYPFVLSATGHL
jgi:hypothetical protein